MEVTEECQLCGGVSTSGSTTGGRWDSVWRYLYEENVRKTWIPSVGDADQGGCQGGRQEGVPKLTFTFSMGGTSFLEEEGEQLVLCKECLERVEHLEKLQEQLESCKKLIAAQVEEIENVCGRETAVEEKMEGLVGRRNRKLESLRRRGAAEGGLDVALAGTCVGGDNISQVLRSLGSLCEGISTNHRNSPPPQNVTYGEILTAVPFATTDTTENNSSYVAAGPPADPLLSVEGGGNINHPKTLGPSSVGDVEDALTFTNTLKLEPEGTEDESDGDSSLDSDNDPLQDMDYFPKSWASQDGYRPPSGRRKTTPPKIFPARNSSLPRATPAPRGIKRKPLVHKRPITTGPSKTGGSTKVPCKVCGKLLKSHSLYYHMRSHKVYAQFECEVCERTFTRREHLDNHRRTHTGEKPYTCHTCDRRFARGHTLKSHLKKCKGKAFVQ